MTKLLVTGANGFIGKNVVERLSSMKNIEVISTDVRFDSNSTMTNVKKIELDLFSNASNENLYELLDKPDVIIHLAYRNGFVHNDYSHIQDLEKHLKLFENYRSFPNIKSISLMGTMHEIGYHEGAINEYTECHPTNFYGIAKNALRQYVLGNKTGCAVKWLRAFYIYDNNGRGNSIFSKIYRASKEGKKNFPLTSGKNMCDYISLDELGLQIACASLQDKTNGIINVCSGKAISLKEAVSYYVKENHLDIQFEFNKFPDRAYDSPFVYGDGSKISDIIKEFNLENDIRNDQ